jgi:thioredoxin 1
VEVQKMKSITKAAIVGALVVAVILVVGFKRSRPTTDAARRSGEAPSRPSTSTMSAESAATTTETKAGLPQLIDLGSKTCIPCKMMVPVLAELAQEYAGRLEVKFVDVNENPEAAQRFAIRLIPTQVFLDASGKELSRHEGFFSKEDIVAKWRELGIDFTASAQ